MKSTRLTVVGVSLVASLVALLTSATLAYSSGELKPLLTVFFNCAATTPCLSSQNSGTGLGIQGVSRQGYFGVYGYSDNVSGAAYSGQYGAVRGYSNSLNGTGVYGYAKKYGVIGLQYDTTVYGNGVFGRCYSSGCDAIYAYTTAVGASWGLRGYSLNSYALFADSGNANTYDAYFPTRIRAGATTIQSTGMSMDALNNGGEAVGPGDVLVFNGFVDTASGRILAVRKANGASDTAVVGVVQSTLIIEGAATNADIAVKQQPPAAEAVLEEEEPIASAGAEAAAAETASAPIQTASFVEGAAGPGQNLTVLIQGITKVKVDASGLSIRAGDTLVASGNAGFAASAASANAESRDDENTDARDGEEESGDASARVAGAVVGRALESLEGGTGEIYVLVGAR